MARFSNPLKRRDLAKLGTMLAAGATALAAGSKAAASESAPAAKPGTVPADDKLEMIELMALYAWGYDTGDTQGILDTFTEDGILYGFGDESFDRQTMRAFFERVYQLRAEHGWQHLTNHHVFRDYDGANCTIYSYYQMPESDPQGGNVTMRAMGYYVSRCAKVGGAWKFRERSIVRWNGKRPW